MNIEGSFSRVNFHSIGDFLWSRWDFFKIKIEYFLKVIVTSTSRSDPLFDHSGTFYSRGGTFLKTMVELLLISRSGFLRSRIFVSTFHFSGELFYLFRAQTFKDQAHGKKITHTPSHSLFSLTLNSTSQLKSKSKPPKIHKPLPHPNPHLIYNPSVNISIKRL